jgi:hypothetical protein
MRDDNTYAITGVSNKDSGLGTQLLDVIATKINNEEAREIEMQGLETELISEIYHGEEQHSSQPLQLMLSRTKLYQLHEAFLSNLRYEMMKDREGRFAEAYGSTFRWIFDDRDEEPRKWSSFREWLKSDSQLYWISGKAGSGKSTLMKYICTTRWESSKEYLKEWSKGCQLMMASFYFWNSDTQSQMTQAGLFRSLLSQILTQVPELISKVAPDRWEILVLFKRSMTQWTNKELQSMIELAVATLQVDQRICLFINGSDKFDGDYNKIIDLFKFLLENHSVKICISSRPWVVFEEMRFVKGLV